MGSTTIQRSPAFPLVFTSDKLREIERSAYAAKHLLPPARDQRRRRAAALGSGHSFVGGGPGRGPGASAAPAPTGAGRPPPRLCGGACAGEPGAFRRRVASASTLALVSSLSPHDGVPG